MSTKSQANNVPKKMITDGKSVKRSLKALMKMIPDELPFETTYEPHGTWSGVKFEMDVPESTLCINVITGRRAL